MRVAIVGSREYPDLPAVRRYVAGLPSDSIVISGGARGVDEVAMAAAKERGLRGVVVRPGSPSNMMDYHARNDCIILCAHRVVAFYDGVSKGTGSVIAKCRAQNVPVHIITPIAASPPPAAEPAP